MKLPPEQEGRRRRRRGTRESAAKATSQRHGLDRRRPARHAGRMHAADRFRLLGTYRTPRFRYGKAV